MFAMILHVRLAGRCLPRPRAFFLALVSATFASTLAEAAASPPCAASSLAEVLARVGASPRVDAASQDTEAQRELTRQAGARPNPDVRLEIEDFTGSGQYTDFAASQTTLSFAQKIELGGVRDRRVDAASREGDAVAARGDSERAQAIASAKQRYLELAAAAETLKAMREAEELARGFLAETERRGASAAASEADVARARVAATSASLDVEKTRRDLAVAAGRLAATWGGTPSEADCYASAAAVRAMRLPAVPRDAKVSGALVHAPAVAVAEADVETKRAEVALERAHAAPDLEVGAGVRYHAWSAVSAVAEMRIEVPIFDRNEGAIAAAERKLAAAQSRALAVRSETEARAARLRDSMAAAAVRERSIATQMIPAAESAAASLARAWQSGAASTFELLDARRSLLDLRRQRIDAASEYWAASATLDAVAGNATADLDAAPTSREEH